HSSPSSTRGSSLLVLPALRSLPSFPTRRSSDLLALLQHLPQLYPVQFSPLRQLLHPHSVQFLLPQHLFHSHPVHLPPIPHLLQLHPLQHPLRHFLHHLPPIPHLLQLHPLQHPLRHFLHHLLPLQHPQAQSDSLPQRLSSFHTRIQ